MDIEISQVALLKKDLSNEERMQFDMQFAGQRKTPTTALIFSLFLGGLGIDRFYIGNVGLGIGKTSYARRDRDLGNHRFVPDHGSNTTSQY